MTHRFAVDQLVQSKSGGLYRVRTLRSDNHRKLAGEPGYDVFSIRDGKPFGPIRLMRESALSPVLDTDDAYQCQVIHDIRKDAGNPLTHCPTCVRPADQPYRRETFGGVVVEGCTDAYHSTAPDAWWLRPESVELRKAHYSHIMRICSTGTGDVPYNE